MPSLNLTGQQSQMVEDALRAAFPSESELAAMFFHATNIRLNDLVAEQQAGKARAFKLLEAVETKGLTTQLLEGAVRENPGNAQLIAVVARIMPGFEPPEPSAYELANRSQFDLKDLDDTYWDTIQPSPEAKKRLVGFGVAYSDDTFISLMRERLAGHLGRNTNNWDPYELNPKRSPATLVLKRIGALKESLRTKHSLYVVRANEADDASIAELWQGLSQTYPDPLDSFLIVVIIKEAAAAFPPAVTPLPNPKFKYSHLLAWSTQLVKQLRKANGEWEPVDTWAQLWSNRLHSQSLEGGVLDVRLVYDNLKADIEELRMNETEFRLSLKKD